MGKRGSKQKRENPVKKLPSNIERFMQFASRNKLLSFVYSLFIPCLIFVINFYVTAPNKWLDFEQKSKSIDYSLIEDQKIDSIYGAVLDALDAAIKSDERYFGIIDQMKEKKEIPPKDQIQEVVDIMSKNIATINISIDLLRGTKLSDSRLSDYPVEFAQNIESIKSAQIKSRDVLLSIINGDTTTVLNNIQEHSSAWYEANNTVLELHMRARDFTNMAGQISSEEEISIKKATNDIKFFRTQELLTIPAVGFLFCVVMYTIIKFKLFTRKQR